MKEKKCQPLHPTKFWHTGLLHVSCTLFYGPPVGGQGAQAAGTRCGSSENGGTNRKKGGGGGAVGGKRLSRSRAGGERVASRALENTKVS